MTIWVGVKATVVGWHIVWCERRFDLAKRRLARAVQRGRRLSQMARSS